MSDKHSLERKLQRVGGLKEKYPPWRGGGGGVYGYFVELHNTSTLNADNGHLFLSKTASLANADSSLLSVFC